MFESLTRRFSDIWGRLRNRKITAGNVQETLRDIRVALLEADVALPVVKDFLVKVEQKALGEEVLKGVNPGQQFVETVYRELAELMGPVDSRIPAVKPGPTIILMAGLQGSGKTTTCAKLALLLKKQGRRPLLVAADIQRPAAIDQLKILGAQIGAPVFSEADIKPPQICQHAIRHARENDLDPVILDTAGRLHIDEEMMREVKEVAHLAQPHEIFLVVDAMVGQDAVRSARDFNEQLELTGVILTKLDGDARGGAALSVKSITGKPIKFAGVGEKVEGGLEEFRPEGMAQRILGFGDVISLVQKARQVIDEKEAAALQERLLSNTFTFDDFLNQLRRVRQMGNFKDLLKMLPGMGGFVDQMDIDDQELVRIEAIIQSMTTKERTRPEILNTSRRDRIASGSGSERQQVDDLIRQFTAMKKMMDQMTQVGGKGPLGKIKDLFQAKKKLSNINEMMANLAKADPEIARAQKAQRAAAQGPSREELRRRRKLERQNRRRQRRY
ncbi:MAG: signal recognition particle protein [Planctomycetes bacterium]|nr:signal recognition particle protein [Planctomycetota bacterium]